MTEEKFLEIVSSALEVNVSELNLETKMYDIESWDSLGQLAILTALSESTEDKTSEIDGLGSMIVLSDIFNAVKDI
tara:strand:+ start:183 stop:410 length:228 start_codon:yes stop_codon:yes gene_type:complete